MRKVLVCLLTLALVLGCMSVQAEGVLTPGTYTSTMTAMHGPMTVEVTVTDSAITSVEVVDQVETPGVTDPVFEKFRPRLWTTKQRPWIPSPVQPCPAVC